MITIYLNKEKTSVHIVKPSKYFDGDVKGLVETVTYGNYHSYTID